MQGGLAFVVSGQMIGLLLWRSIRNSPWEGTTWFALVGSDLPWENDVWPGTGRPNARREDEPPEGGDRGGGEGSTGSPRGTTDESGSTRSRSRSRAGGDDAAARDYLEAVSTLGAGTPVTGTW